VVTLGWFVGDAVGLLSERLQQQKSTKSVCQISDHLLRMELDSSSFLNILARKNEKINSDSSHYRLDNKKPRKHKAYGV